MNPRIVVGVVLVVLVGTIVYRMVARPTTVQIGAAEMGTVRREIIGPGTVQSRHAVSVASRVAGTIDRVLVDVGDVVEKGQLLATLDRTELDARTRAAGSAVASATQEVELARANLARARADLDLARRRDERAQQLLAPGVIAAEEADETHGALEASRANERAARAAVDAGRASVRRLTEEEGVAEIILAYTALESPMAGVITRRALEPGSAVAPGAVVFQLVDPDALWVATLVDQSLAGQIEVGQDATIELRSGATLPGHVARIAFEADPVTRELEIDVAFDERPARFAIHEEADVTIRGAAVPGLTVPLEAVRYGRDGGASVLVVEEGRAARRPVRLGIVGAKRAIVVEGLAEGARVILSPQGIQDRQRVDAAGGGR